MKQCVHSNGMTKQRCFYLVKDQNGLPEIQGFAFLRAKTMKLKPTT